MAAKTAGTVENFAQGYQDYLQSPLQVSEPDRSLGTSDVDAMRRGGRSP